jgi:DNA-binding NtrC family response regulator
MAAILVVEDDPAFGGTILQMLKSGGHQATLVVPPADVVAAIDAEAPALAICDVWLGQTDGIALAKQLNEIRPDMPVILMSGGDGRLPLETVTAMADMQGVASVLYKPFRIETLLKAVDAAL